MTKTEIELRRQQLTEEFFALANGSCDRGREICQEIGRLAEEEDNLMRRLLRPVSTRAPEPKPK